MSKMISGISIADASCNSPTSSQHLPHRLQIAEGASIPITLGSQGRHYHIAYAGALFSTTLSYLSSVGPLSSINHQCPKASKCGDRSCLRYSVLLLPSPLELISHIRVLLRMISPFSLDSVVLSIVLLNTFTASVHAASRFISGL